MQVRRSLRFLLLALIIFLIPASSRAAVFVSVGIAPPPLPVYVQPPCPEPGWMWTPGYWAYGGDGYYWVPGTWVAAPEPGLYWTPGYWGWGAGLYAWHPGYWGPTVGYYGGVNYGFGFFGVGFVGGMWHGGVFAYNTAVVHVNTVVIHNVYVDHNVIAAHTVAMNSHVAFSGGPGGINHPPTAEERVAMNQHHYAATSMQTQHQNTAMHNTNAYFSHNGGHPTNAAVARPMQASRSVGSRPSGGMNRSPGNNGFNNSRPNEHNAPQHTEHESRPQHESHPESHGHDNGH
jgi:hypothetical protein